LGLFDVSTIINIPRQEEDLGQTLAVWGVKDGPYLMLPFLGPSNMRDATTLGVEWLSTDLVPILFSGTERWLIGGARLVDARASILGLEAALQFQVDPYIFLRESYRQSRLDQINDGAPQPGAEEDPFEDALFAE
jgi:phospholipid-binding lipoprotein MlaA